MGAADTVYADVLAAAEEAELAALTVWDRLARHVGDYDPAVLEEWGTDGVTLVGGPECGVWTVGLCFDETGGATCPTTCPSRWLGTCSPRPPIAGTLPRHREGARSPPTTPKKISPSTPHSQPVPPN